MDPYIETPSFWGGFHSNLISRIQTSLNRQLPDRYYAEIEEFVWLEHESTTEGQILIGKPDLLVGKKSGTRIPRSSSRVSTAMIAPSTPAVEVTLPEAKRRKRKYVKVVGPDHQTVVTVIEVLSPSNKQSGSDRNNYLNKREEWLARRVNFVEIDLLRGGGRMPFGEPSPQDADYYLFLCRGSNYPKAEVWPITIREGCGLCGVREMSGFGVSDRVNDGRWFK
jgi:hypothetical protein